MKKKLTSHNSHNHLEIKRSNILSKKILRINSEEPLNDNKKTTGGKRLINNYLHANSNKNVLLSHNGNSLLNVSHNNLGSNNQLDTNFFEYDKIVAKNYIPFYKKIPNYLYDFIDSTIANILLLIINIFSIIFSDIINLCFKNKYKYIYLIFYFIFIAIYLFDVVFKKIFIDKICNTIYFWINLLSYILLVLDIEELSYPFFGKLLYNITDLNELNFNEQFYIEIYINSFKILKLLRILNVYKLIEVIKKDSEIKIFAKKYNEKKKQNKIIKTQKIQKKLINASNYIMNIQNSSINPALYNNSNSTFINQLNNTISLNTNNNINSNNFNNLIENKTNIMKLNNMSHKLSIEDSKLEEKKIYKYIKKNKLFNESKVSKKIEKLMAYIIILILLSCSTINYFANIDYSESNIGYEILCKNFNNYYEQYSSNEKTQLIINNFLNISINNKLKNYPIIAIKYNNTILYQNISLNKNFEDNYYHRQDYSYIFIKPYINKTIIIILKKNITKIESIINIFRFIFILSIFTIFLFIINKDIYKLIFEPLKKIIKIIDLVAKDPVNGKTIKELKNLKNSSKEFSSFESEIKIIENVIIRVSELMAISFGEAGGEIIKKNIMSSEGLNPMLKGNRIQAVFGFCYIHHFSEINEVFQEKTNIFVNILSDIVHSSVDKFNGINNKNLGDCFVLAWKFKENSNKDNNKNKINNLNQSFNIASIRKDMGLNDSNGGELLKINEKADSALLAFLNIIKKINKSKEILKYRKDPLLIKKFGKNFSVQMGFGLHYGWGIEGAIGSLYKIDCSYLSPNVNLAARLETATNIYQVDILLSGEFYNLLSDYMKNYCRKIDIVTVKGSKKPISLYTIDVNKNIKKGKMSSKKDFLNLKDKRNYYMLKKKKLWSIYNTQFPYISIGEIYIKKSKGMQMLLKKNKTDMFYEFFNEGIEQYIEGNWNEAYNSLIKAKYLENNDGPTNVIINFLKEYNLEKPYNWKGYRELTSKT